MIAGFSRLAGLLLTLLAPVAFAQPELEPIERVIVRRDGYDYAPAIVKDESRYRLYWCGGVVGDFILHALADDPIGPWHSSVSMRQGSYDVSLKPTGNRADFDGRHACDPSVIKVGNTYYLYYGGVGADDDLTAIGVARSQDGVRFTRLNSGRPIVTAAQTSPDFRRNRLTYGAGQPSALFIEPYFYLSISDSTGAGSNPANGAGQFLLRARDPEFRLDLQELTARGWAPRRAGEHSAEYSYLESFGLDLLLDEPTHKIVAATNRESGKTTILFLEPETFVTVERMDMPFAWREQPALLGSVDKTTLPRQDCGTFPATVVSAKGPSPSPWSWDLAMATRTLRIAGLCRARPAPR